MTEIKAIEEVFVRDLLRLANMNATSFQSIFKIREYLRKRLATVMNSNDIGRQLPIIEEYIAREYGRLFLGLRDDIIEDYNQSTIEAHYIAEAALNARIDWGKIRLIDRLPSKRAFSYTNKIFNEKSVSIRSRKMARQVTQTIGSSVKKGYGVEKTGEILDIIFGYRDKDGNINRKAIELMEKGKLTQTNGHFYQTYRIARTESMRMTAISNNEVFDELKTKRSDSRLQLISRIDNRTREQSINMNGQISDAKGRFKYPDGQYYRHGEAPAQWSINDRETTITIFLDAKKQGGALYKSIDDFVNKSKERDLIV